MLDGRAKPKMPPDDEPPVPEADLALLKRWIAEEPSRPPKTFRSSPNSMFPASPAAGRRRRSPPSRIRRTARASRRRAFAASKSEARTAPPSSRSASCPAR
ncbi:MAG: hypothetical protein R3F11_25140 [Verrucomicrobiales bacterium]